MNSPAPAYLQFVLLFAFLIPAVLFLVTQQNTLKAVKRENRLMMPGLVWLQVVPVIGQVWQFVVVVQIAGSLRKEIESRQEATVLGVLDDDSIGQLGKRPTLVIGICYCILTITGLLLNLYLTFDRRSSTVGIVTLINLAGIICWIIYWIQLAGAKRKLFRAAAMTA